MKPLTSFCYTSDDYPVFFRKWERCRDIFAGSDLVKSLGDKYLPKSRWHRHGGADGKQDYEDYKAKIEQARKIMPDIEFSSDFIVGFPNETDEDFNATLKAVEEIGYDRIFAFNYSPRPGTKAFDIEDNVPANVKSERLNNLFALQDSLYDKRLPEMKGITTQVLVTEIDETKEYPYYGLNIYNRKVAFSSKNKLEYGSIVNVLIDTAKRNCMYGVEV